MKFIEYSSATVLRDLPLSRTSFAAVRKVSADDFPFSFSFVGSHFIAYQSKKLSINTCNRLTYNLLYLNKNTFRGWLLQCNNLPRGHCNNLPRPHILNKISYNNLTLHLIKLTRYRNYTYMWVFHPVEQPIDLT